ncbi:MAG: hypothetical protein QCH35_04430 [Methanomicrobiaceae archaeon]|nr:hypothetical protein [Methanomicrobiaceae archaeon]
MVNDQAQMYTLEGFAAGVLMLLTAYLVLGTTTVYTPGDVHITDMQLQQLGSDALAMMDTPNSHGDTNELVNIINTTDHELFDDSFMANLQNLTESTDTCIDDLQYNASVYYRAASGEVASYPLATSDRGDLVSREPAVRVTRWVTVNGESVSEIPEAADRRNPQLVLVEVLLWRG